MTADARPASQPRHEVEVRLDLRIPMDDGLELSANLWLPVPRRDAPDERFPVILEILPYRKDDWHRPGDERRGRWLAARGFALCRLDVRGTGSSPGIALDEYTARETRDGFETVEWLAAQPWSNGNVGMWGISYGGFTAIQVAKLRPPHLRAIVPMYATDDRYLDDVHYVGGCVTVSELSQYAVSMVGMNALPARPAFRGDAWLDEWRERLEATPVWLFEWLRQQHDGPYWRQGSLAPEYEALGGGDLPHRRLDGRLRRPGPAHARALRQRTAQGAHRQLGPRLPGRRLPRSEPRLAPRDGPLLRPLAQGRRQRGHGRACADLLHPRVRGTGAISRELAGALAQRTVIPPPGATETSLWLGAGDLPLAGRLTTEPGGGDGADRFPHRATTGTRTALSWGAGSPPNGLARDLRLDDALVPTYTGAALTAPLEILGNPIAVLAIEASMPVATLVARLSDVAPDGTAAQVAAGVLNLTHRDSHASPAALEPGQRYEVRSSLRAAGYRFAPGHRIRLSLASNYWPVLWPSPYPGEVTVHHQGSRLVLPTVPTDGDSLPTPVFKTTSAGLDEDAGGEGEPPVWRIVEDVIAGTLTVSTNDAGVTAIPDGGAVFAGERLEMTASDADPAHARMANEVHYWLDQDGRRIDIRAGGETTSTETDFRMTVRLAVDLDGQPYFARDWDETIPRRLV